MKKLIVGIAITVSIFLTAGVQAKYIDKYTEKKLVQVCKAIKSDSRVKLNRAIKDSGISAKALGRGLVCNGYDPVTFAIVNGSQITGKHIAVKANLNYDELFAKL